LPNDRSPGGLAAWREAMRVASRMPNIAVKISGLGNPAVPWNAEALRPIVLDALDYFGAERCMFASNYPVDNLVASFDTIYSGFKSIVAGLHRDQQAALFARNARRIYRIP
jgi:predicted TIM-barrel fold metal-dependent hydrolase